VYVRERERERERERKREERERKYGVSERFAFFFTKTHHNQKNVDLQKVDNIFGWI